MNTLLLEKLARWPRCFLSGTDLKIILDHTDDSRYGIIKRAVKDKWLIRIRKDLYLIDGIFQKELPDTFEIAQLIYGPSYISFESALSYHQWIPEGVATTTSASSKRGVKFKTELGFFTYEHIPIDIFSVGLHSVERENSMYLMAEPWKAVADLIYSRNKSWPDLASFSGDMRVEIEILKDSNQNVLAFLSETYPCTRTRKVLNKFYGDLKCLKI